MLTKDKIIGIFCFIDDLLKTSNHYEDSRRQVSDSEIITTAVVSSLYFGGHQDKARQLMKMTGMIPECWIRAVLTAGYIRLQSLYTVFSCRLVIVSSISVVR